MEPLDAEKPEAMFNEWLEDKWDAGINVNKLSERSRKPAPRTIKSRIEYTAGSAHALLHRDAAATRKALNHPDVKAGHRAHRL